jgi:hypothetical protein
MDAKECFCVYVHTYNTDTWENVFDHGVWHRIESVGKTNKMLNLSAQIHYETLHYSFKIYDVNAVLNKIFHLWRDPYKTHEYTPWEEYRSF